MATALEQLLDSPENLEYLARQSRLLSLSPRRLFELVQEMEKSPQSADPSFRKSLESVSGQLERRHAESEGPDKVGTAYDAAVRLGIIGVVKSPYNDLSTNPKHFEGFGA